jgi:hypothetical protein
MGMKLQLRLHTTSTRNLALTASSFATTPSTFPLIFSELQREKGRGAKIPSSKLGLIHVELQHVGVCKFFAA